LQELVEQHNASFKEYTRIYQVTLYANKVAVLTVSVCIYRHAQINSYEIAIWDNDQEKQIYAAAA
jgi:hypothetical protein